MGINNRRDFLKATALSGLGLAIQHGQPDTLKLLSVMGEEDKKGGPDIPFYPNRVASWWCTLEDIQWPQKDIRDKIKRRAAAFAEAKIDTAINYGFHVRFDFSNYFGQLHGYQAEVCNELHKYGIKFLDHYSCNHVERPRNEKELMKLAKGQRHHTLLFHDEVAAKHAQYEGYKFQDICQVDLRDGGRGYTPIYQFETFCHNNPNFLDMHRKYLERLMKEVPMDGIEVDDMCDYAGLYVCGCKYCRERFQREYGREIPPLTDKSFWGTIKSEFNGGNYDNPAFRDWIRMRTASVADHVKMVKEVIGNKPLMTCCASSGPVLLNALTLNLESMAPHLDLFMLENVGINVNSVDWTKMDAEALVQKDMAEKRGKAPAMAISYTIYKDGGYLGWALSRFWGVSNWSSTQVGRLESDPPDAMNTEDVVGPYNRWEVANSDLPYWEGKDLEEVRLVSNKYCRDNGYRNEENKEHWDSCLAWSKHLLQHNVGYRFLMAEELSNARTLQSAETPLILDNVGCVSDAQFKAIEAYLRKGGTAWVALPFGTHDDKGFRRDEPLSKKLEQGKYRNLVIMPSAIKGDQLQTLIQNKKFHPALVQTGGDKRWAARVRRHKGKMVIHFMNTALIPVPHPTLKDAHGNSILQFIDSDINDNKLSYAIDTRKVPLGNAVIMSPEWNEKQVHLEVKNDKSKWSTLGIDLSGLKTYAIVQ